LDCWLKILLTFLALPDRSSAVMVVHDAQNGLTQIFALTDGSTISNRSGTNAVELHGGRRSRSLRALPLSPMVQAIKPIWLWTLAIRL
jgi:hypothetical protein